MSQCQKCNQFFPPGFVGDTNPKTGERLKGNLCIFCSTGKDTIEYSEGSKKVTKKEIIKEYQIFMRKVKEDNNLIIEGNKGKPIKGAERIIL